MKTVLLPLAFLFALAALTATAQLPAPADLPAASQRQATAREAIARQADEAETALRKWYDSALDAVQKDAQAKGDLDRVLAVKQEHERAGRDLTPEEKGALPPVMKSVRDQYDQARTQRANQNKANVTASLRAYLAALETLEKSLTQKADIDGALAVRKERTAVGEQLSAIQTAVATAPPVAPPPPVTPPPAVGAATPAPATPPAAAKPAIALSSATKARTVEVCEELKCHDSIKKPAPEAIAFLSPPGPMAGFRGRGLLLKNDPTTGRRGTTWSFAMMRKAPHAGIQIIHPLGDGQIIVHLRDEGLTVLSSTEMANTPWVGGDPKRIRLTTDAKKLFPLTGQIFNVTSELSGSGVYVISINGKVVGRASLDAGPALALNSGYEGARLPAGVDFPLRWDPGYAAIITGAVDPGGVLNCRNAVFKVGASIVAP
jgi:hypothetical protein